MTVKYGFYNSLAGDRTYDAADMSQLFDGIIQDGVLATFGDALLVSPESPASMNIVVGTGRAWFNSTWTSNDTPLVLEIDAAEAVLNRIDLVILEVNKATGTRANSIKILKGAPGSTPVAPTLTNADPLFQYALCSIYIAAASPSIDAGDITNLVGSVDTPFVTGVIDTVDLNSVFAQYEAEFDAWFQNLQDQLDENQAGNLQNQIDDINAILEGGLETGGWTAIDAPASYSSVDSPTGVVSFNADLTAVLQKGMRVSYEQTQALSAYWSFDASSAAGVGSFSMSNIGTPTYTAGKFSNALTLDGSTDALSIADTAVLKPTVSFTIGAWIKTTGSSNQDIFTSYQTTPNPAGIKLFVMSTGVVRLTIGNASGGLEDIGYTLLNSTSLVNNGNWHYVVATYNNRIAQLYVDGILEASKYSVQVAYDTTNYIRIGCIYTSGTNAEYFNGQIDDLFIINNYALDEKTIRDKYIANIAQGISDLTVEKMGLITDVGNHSGGVTLVTVYHGTDFKLVNSVISNPRYSSMKIPYGFNANPNKWSVFVSDPSDKSKTYPSASVWYGRTNLMNGNSTLPAISIPIGIWNLRFSCVISANANPSSALNIYTTLSTSQNAISDPDFTASANNGGSSGNMYVMQTVHKDKIVNLREKTIMYMLLMTGVAAGSIDAYGFTVSPAKIIATSAYL